MEEYLNGWLSPVGVFYSCEFMGHRDLARELETELDLAPQLDIYGTTVHGERLLEILGWIKLYANKYNKDGNIFKYERCDFRKLLTEQQIKFLDSVRYKMIGKQEEDYGWILKRFNEKNFYEE